MPFLGSVWKEIKLEFSWGWEYGNWEGVSLKTWENYFNRFYTLSSNCFHFNDKLPRIKHSFLRPHSLLCRFTYHISAENILFLIWPYVLWSVTKVTQYIKVRKLFEGGNYLQKYGNTKFLLAQKIALWYDKAGMGGCQNCLVR